MTKYALILMKRFDTTYYPAVVDKDYRLTYTDKVYGNKLVPLPDTLAASDPAGIIEWAYDHAGALAEVTVSRGKHV